MLVEIWETFSMVVSSMSGDDVFFSVAMTIPFVPISGY